MLILVKKILKTNRFIYGLYYVIFSFLLRCMGLLSPLKQNRILFMSFGGKRFDDSPKAIYECMQKDKRFSSYECIWAFDNPEDFKTIDLTVKIDTLKFFWIALSSKCWITNSSIERGLSFKKTKTLYINTWHGTPLKKMGIDINENLINIRGPFHYTNGITVQSKLEENVFVKSMGAKSQSILKFGLPRNDILFNYSSTLKAEIRKKLNIKSSQVVILYAPTFREFQKSKSLSIVDVGRKYIDELIGKLPTNYIVLYRAHYAVDKLEGKAPDNRIINVSDYPELNDLIIGSDMLLTDYSSVMFDYSITGKPIVIFSYDFLEYSKRRGMYFDVEHKLSYSRDVEGIYRLIMDRNKTPLNNTKKFLNEYVNYGGNATEKLVDYIIGKLKVDYE